jgi:hypothetical protein
VKAGKTLLQMAAALLQMLQALLLQALLLLLLLLVEEVRCSPLLPLFVYGHPATAVHGCCLRWTAECECWKGSAAFQGSAMGSAETPHCFRQSAP